jgi:hypothetical protein
MKSFQILQLSVLVFLLVGCSAENPAPFPLFKEGSMVKSVVSLQVGQVTKTRCWSGEDECYYDVRFHATQSITNTALIGSDAAIEQLPLAIIRYMRDFELVSTDQIWKVANTKKWD